MIVIRSMSTMAVVFAMALARRATWLANGRALIGVSLLAGGMGLFTAPDTVAAEPAKLAELSTETFRETQNQIKPQAGESRWLEIPWEIDLHAARKKAAAEGRPLLVMSGGGATAIGTC